MSSTAVLLHQASSCSSPPAGSGASGLRACPSSAECRLGRGESSCRSRRRCRLWKSRPSPAKAGSPRRTRPRLASTLRPGARGSSRTPSLSSSSSEPPVRSPEEPALEPSAPSQQTCPPARGVCAQPAPFSSALRRHLSHWWSRPCMGERGVAERNGTALSLRAVGLRAKDSSELSVGAGEGGKPNAGLQSAVAHRGLSLLVLGAGSRCRASRCLTLMAGVAAETPASEALRRSLPTRGVSPSCRARSCGDSVGCGGVGVRPLGSNPKSSAVGAGLSGQGLFHAGL
mmetsp:Transcript_42847/g.101716  ORF Transcript_42847/g.101716 Transcript_42847/m.101716 type:complete len:286 (+) Transcript_42847:164-1021(+)